jgi:hypothetical protein
VYTLRPYCGRKLGEFKKFNDLVGTRTRDLPACSIAPQLSALPRAPAQSRQYWVRCVGCTDPAAKPDVLKLALIQPGGYWGQIRKTSNSIIGVPTEFRIMRTRMDKFHFLSVDGVIEETQDTFFWLLIRGGEEISLPHAVQTGSGAYPSFYLMCTGSSYPGGKAAGAWSWPLTFN